jgi:hypothetical protein
MHVQLGVHVDICGQQPVDDGHVRTSRARAARRGSRSRRGSSASASPTSQESFSIDDNP